MKLGKFVDQTAHADPQWPVFLRDRDGNLRWLGRVKVDDERGRVVIHEAEK